jgi:hypothetical protein
MRKIICLIVALISLFSLASCKNVEDNIADLPDNPNSAEKGEVSKEILPEVPPFNVPETDENQSDAITPYLSIICRRDNPDSEDEAWDEVYYTYDLVTKELQEICVLPHLSGYTAGVVSLWDDAVYFSMREYDRSNDRICKYDIKSGKMAFIEDENFTYNDFTLIDENTLLLVTSTRERTLTPALFDIESKKFTYMADANEEDFTLYTSGPILLNYNYLYEEFAWLYFKLSDRDSDAYHSTEGAIDHNFIMISKDLKKSDTIFTTQFTALQQISFLTQISEGTVLVKFIEIVSIFEDPVSKSGFIEDIGEERYYHLTFDSGHTSFVEIENPFPAATSVTQCLTFDGGKTYYCCGSFLLDNVRRSGLFIYDCDTDEITPILLSGDEIMSVANFRSVG